MELISQWVMQVFFMLRVDKDKEIFQCSSAEISKFNAERNVSKWF